jgi:hypothetical protein
MNGFSGSHDYQGVRDWLTPAQLGRLCGLKPNTIRKRIARGVYRNTMIDESHRRGFLKRKALLININDSAIGEDVRILHRKRQEQILGMFPRDNARICTQMMEEIMENLRKIEAYFKATLERLSKNA